MKSELESLLLRINEAVDRLPEPVLRAFIPALQEAEAELRAALVRLGLKGSDTFTAQQYRRALVQLRQAQSRIRATNPILFDLLANNISHVSSNAIAHLQEELVTFSKRYKGTLNDLAIDESALIAHGERMLIPRFKGSAARYAGGLFQDIKRQLAIGMLRGETFGEMTTRLARTAGLRNPRGAGPDEAAAGLFKKYRGWANRLVRTEVIGAYNDQFHQALKELNEDDGGYKMQWNAALDRRVCGICKDLDGQVAKLNEPFRGGYWRPPAHPNCRCALVAWHKDFK